MCQELDKAQERFQWTLKEWDMKVASISDHKMINGVNNGPGVEQEV